MKIIRVLFKDTKNIISMSLEEIAKECTSTPSELEIMMALTEMERDNEIAIMPNRKEY